MFLYIKIFIEKHTIMITSEYAVECLKKGFERYIRQSKINATIKCSATTVSFYVDKTPNNKSTNARVSDHHPNMKNYILGNKTPWFSDNVSIEFIIPDSQEDKRFRPRIRQNAQGTVQPFDVTVYQYNPNILNGQDLLDIFKGIVVFLNGNGYTDPFQGTNKEAIVKPRHSNIKPYRENKTTTNESRTFLTESILNNITEHCMREVVIDKKIHCLIKEHISQHLPLMKSVSTTVRMNESEFNEMICSITKQIINEEYEEIGSVEFELENGVKVKSVMSLRNRGGKQTYHIVKDDGCYVPYSQSLKTGKSKPTYYLFPELFNAMTKLPKLPLI